MQEILVLLALLAAFLYILHVLRKTLRGQSSTCGCSCQDCQASSQCTDPQKTLPMHQADTRK